MSLPLPNLMQMQGDLFQSSSNRGSAAKMVTFQLHHNLTKSVLTPFFRGDGLFSVGRHGGGSLLSIPKEENGIVLPSGKALLLPEPSRARTGIFQRES